MLGDIIIELYGARSARRAILTSFAVSILASISYQVIIALPRSPTSTAWPAVGPRTALAGLIVVLAGLAGFLAGQSLTPGSSRG